MTRQNVRSSLHEDNLVFIDEFEVRITPKRVKNMNMRVGADGTVAVSVPVTGRFRSRPAMLTEVERFVRAKADWIRTQQRRAQTSPMARAELASKEEIEQWRVIVKALVPGLVAKWEPVLGVHAGELAYRNMKSRWGSCQPSTGRICINIRLALYPPECLEYVVVHELAHLLVHGHGPAFHAVLDEALPDWRAAKRKLDGR